MDYSKILLITISLVVFVGALCFAVGLTVSNNDHSSSDEWASDASTDGLTYSQIQSKLNHYADIINSKDASIVLSGDVWSRFAGSSFTLDTSGSTIKPIAGTAKVVDGDLIVKTVLNYSITNSTLGSNNYELIIPYHSIVAIKVGSA